MYNIINKKGQICQTFLKKNDNFNLKFFNYLNSKYFIKCKKDFSEKIHFSKNDLNKAHDPFKQYLTTYSITKNSITLKDIFDSLNSSDKKIIEKEPIFSSEIKFVIFPPVCGLCFHSIDSFFWRADNLKFHGNLAYQFF